MYVRDTVADLPGQLPPNNTQMHNSSIRLNKLFKVDVERKMKYILERINLPSGRVISSILESRYIQCYYPPNNSYRRHRLYLRVFVLKKMCNHDS